MEKHPLIETKKLKENYLSSKERTIKLALINYLKNMGVKLQNNLKP
jgi:hypothetical protein